MAFSRPAGPLVLRRPDLSGHPSASRLPGAHDHRPHNMHRLPLEPRRLIARVTLQAADEDVRTAAFLPDGRGATGLPRVGHRRRGDLPGMGTVTARPSATPARRRAGPVTR